MRKGARVWLELHITICSITYSEFSQLTFISPCLYSQLVLMMAHRIFKQSMLQNTRRPLYAAIGATTCVAIPTLFNYHSRPFYKLDSSSSPVSSAKFSSSRSTSDGTTRLLNRRLVRQLSAGSVFGIEAFTSARMTTRLIAVTQGWERASQ